MALRISSRTRASYSIWATPSRRACASLPVSSPASTSCVRYQGRPSGAARRALEKFSPCRSLAAMSAKAWISTGGWEDSASDSTASINETSDSRRVVSSCSTIRMSRGLGLPATALAFEDSACPSCSTRSSRCCSCRAASRRLAASRVPLSSWPWASNAWYLKRMSIPAMLARRAGWVFSRWERLAGAMFGLKPQDAV